MSEDDTRLLRFARELIAMDSRSSESNLPIAERVESWLAGFEIERLDYLDSASVPKRVLVAHRGPPGGCALAAHTDTVPALGWTTDPWEPRVEDGVLHGLGSVDMKGPLASCLTALLGLPENVPATLLLTTDEETTKEGARVMARRSELLPRLGLRGIVVAEPTGLKPVRGHRSFIEFTAVSTGIQAHSASGLGINANWRLIPFLERLRQLHERLRNDTALQDPAYDPPFSDFNLVLDNHGVALNVTPPKATARLKLRRSRRVDVSAIVEEIRQAARDAGLELAERHDGPPVELAADHPLVRLAEKVTGQTTQTAPWGTDASELQAIAPCVVLGPGSIATAHTPDEQVALADLLAAVPIFRALLARGEESLE